MRSISGSAVHLPARLLGFCASFFICLSNLGFRTAWTIFVASRYSARPRKVWLKNLRRDFVFRGRDDIGVMSHFYKSGYRITEGSGLPIRTIVDAGANIGDETIRFRHFHPRARIFAIEAEKNNFGYLEMNVSNDPLVVCINRGLWSRDTKLKISSSVNNEVFSVAEVTEEDAQFDVLAISLQHLIETYKLSSIDILKLDIEGAEFEIFTKNYALWVSMVRALIIECPDHETPGTMAALFHALDFAKFDCHIAGENLVLIRRDTGWKLERPTYYV